MTTVTIDCPPDEMEKNRLRWEAWERFEYVDRVPVMALTATRFFLFERGVGHEEYYGSCKDQIYHQLQNLKWSVERIPDDHCTSTAIEVSPDFGNTCAAAFGGEVHFSDDAPRVVPFLKSPDEMDRLPMPGMRDHMWGRRFQWYEEMLELRHDFRVIFNGQEVPVHVTIWGIDSAFTTAIDLVGGDFLWWIREYPEACHRFLARVNQVYIEWERHCRRLIGKPMTDLVTGADSAEMLSPKDYWEFCGSYIVQMYQAFPGCRGLHMCGNITHLLPTIMEKLELTHFVGLGFQVDLDTVARLFGGKVRFFGNVDPMLVRAGTVEDVKTASRKCLETFAPLGGYALVDGCNLPPGTPLENIAAMREAAIEYGRPTRRSDWSNRQSKAQMSPTWTVTPSRSPTPD